MAKEATETMSWRDITYRRWKDKENRILRGTVEICGRRIHGYPSIGRILVLRPGLSEQFPGSFWVEEKVDGYNVRIAQIDGRMLAFSRGGFICPFTTDRLPDLLPQDVFAGHEDLVLCAEVAGPETPYTKASPPYIKEDVRLFVFDMMRLNSPAFLPQEEAYALADELGLRTVQHLGRFDASQADEVCALLERLDQEGKEGAVFKCAERPEKRVKYTTANASIEDIAVSAPELIDLPPHFYIGRILRLALFLAEHGRGPARTLNEGVGAAFLEGMAKAVEQVRREHRVYLRYSCRFRTEEAARELMALIKQAAGKQVRVRMQSLVREGAYWRLTFDREPLSINGLLQHILKGGALYD